MTDVRVTVRQRRAGYAAVLNRVAAGLSPRRAAVALGLWAAWCAAYRLYYAFGGQLGMIGRPASAAQFRRDTSLAASSSCSPPCSHPLL
jgi:hypothetical protein